MFEYLLAWIHGIYPEGAKSTAERDAQANELVQIEVKVDQSHKAGQITDAQNEQLSDTIANVAKAIDGLPF